MNRSTRCEIDLISAENMGILYKLIYCGCVWKCKHSYSLFQTKCFICGIGNDYFDRTPHGFETHTLQEHNLANYLWVQQQIKAINVFLIYNVDIFSHHLCSPSVQVLPDVSD